MGVLHQLTCVITKTKTRSKKSSIEETPMGFSFTGVVILAESSGAELLSVTGNGGDLFV